MSVVALLKCPRGGLHVFRFGTCATCRMRESDWRRLVFAYTTLTAPRREHG